MNLINFTGEETERKGRTMMRMLSSKIDFNGEKTKSGSCVCRNAFRLPIRFLTGELYNNLNEQKFLKGRFVIFI